MEYFKCHWCGSTLNSYKSMCPNCGGSLDHQSLIKNSQRTNPTPHENELSRTVKKITGVLVLICIALVAVPLYLLFNKGSQNIGLVAKENTVLAPISDLNSGDEQSSLQIHKNPDNLLKKTTHCKLDFDKTITPKVYVVSSYRGLQTSEIQFGRSEHEVRESGVIVNKPSEKIILVLMAYNPVVWKIQKTFDSNIIGVILAGYHNQVITGLPKTTPILEAIYENQTSCKYFYKNIKEGSQKHYIAKRIEDIVGSKPNKYITSAYNGNFYIGNNSPKSPLIQYSDITYQTELKQQLNEKGYSIDKIAAKEDGIIQLINQVYKGGRY